MDNTGEKSKKEGIKERVQTEVRLQLQQHLDQEIQELRHEFENELQAVKAMTRKHRDKIRFVEMKINNLQMTWNEKDVEEMLMAEEKLHEMIKTLEQDIAVLKVELSEKEKIMQEKESCLQDMATQNQDLEKKNKKLTQKAQNLEEYIEAKKNCIEDLEMNINKKENEMLQYYTRNENMKCFVDEKKTKLKELQMQIKEMHSVMYMEALERRVKLDLDNCMRFVQERNKLKENIQEMYQRYTLPDMEETAAKYAAIHSEYDRQREHLEKTVTSQKTILANNAAKHHENKFKIIMDNIAMIQEIKELQKELQFVQDKIKNYETQLKFSKRKDSAVDVKKIKAEIRQRVSKSQPAPRTKLVHAKLSMYPIRKVTTPVYAHRILWINMVRPLKITQLQKDKTKFPPLETPVHKPTEPLAKT